jgi:hypothetical protein
MTFPSEPAGPTPSGAGWPAAPVVPRGRRPSAGGYWVGALILAVGGIGALIWMFTAIFSVFGAAQHYPRFSIPGERTMSLTPGTYKVFVEYVGASNTFSSPPTIGTISVTDPGGSSVMVLDSPYSDSYNWQGLEGRSVAEFRAPTAGSYVVAVAPLPSGTPRSLQVAVGKGLDNSVAGQVVGAVLLGGAAFVIGLILIIVTAIRRGRWKRQNTRPPTYPGGPPYGAPPYGAPPYPAAPYPAAPYPAAPYPGTQPAPPVAGDSWPPQPAEPLRPTQPAEPLRPTHPPGWGSAPGAAPDGPAPR